MERHTYGPDHFLAEQRITRALLKFCVDHGSTTPAIENVRACLAALEIGERSNAVEAFKRVRMGPDGFNDWFPPAVEPSETGEHAWAVFEALVERWIRLMMLLE